MSCSAVGVPSAQACDGCKSGTPQAGKDTRLAGSDVRGIERVLQTFFERRGHGEIATHSIGRKEQQHLDPFLLFEDVTTFEAEEIPAQMHLGMESISYVIKGRFTYEDLSGTLEDLESGTVKRMMTGSGLIHSVSPATRERNQILRLWINLPPPLKLCQPQTSTWRARQLPHFSHSRGVSAKLVAGAAPQQLCSTELLACSPMAWLDVRVQPGGKLVYSIPHKWSVFAYVVDGSLTVDSGTGLHRGPHPAKHTIVFAPEGKRIVLRNRGRESCRFMLITGQPGAHGSSSSIGRWDYKVVTEQEVASSQRECEKSEELGEAGSDVQSANSNAVLLGGTGNEGTSTMRAKRKAGSGGGVAEAPVRRICRYTENICVWGGGDASQSPGFPGSFVAQGAPFGAPGLCELAEQASTDGAFNTNSKRDDCASSTVCSHMTTVARDSHDVSWTDPNTTGAEAATHNMEERGEGASMPMCSGGLPAACSAGTPVCVKKENEPLQNQVLALSWRIDMDFLSRMDSGSDQTEESLSFCGDPRSDEEGFSEVRDSEGDEGGRKIPIAEEPPTQEQKKRLAALSRIISELGSQCK